MEYCSLEAAFAPIGGGPAPVGCKDAKAGSAARKEERKKAKRCKGPPLTFLEGSGDVPVTDPDRPAVHRLPETPPLNRATGLIEHAPVDAPPREAFEDMSPEPQAELAASYESEQAPSDLEYLNTMPTAVAGPNKQQKRKVPNFFGANFDSDDSMEEGFAAFTNIIGDDPAYRLSPDFSSAFAGKGVNKASGSDVLPIPSVKNVWKPLTQSGAPTAFYNQLPSPGGEIPIGQTTQSWDKEEMFRKLDSIYARLDDLETRRGEHAQTETMMFIMSGIFILFTMDLLVKKTGNIRVMNA